MPVVLPRLATPASVEATLLPLPLLPVLTPGLFTTPTAVPAPELPEPELPVLLPRLAMPASVDAAPVPLHRVWALRPATEC